MKVHVPPLHIKSDLMELSIELRIQEQGDSLLETEAFKNKRAKIERMDLRGFVN